MEQIKKLSEQCEQWQKADAENRVAFVLLAQKNEKGFESGGFAEGNLADFCSVLSQIMIADPAVFEAINYAIELTKKKHNNNNDATRIHGL